MGNARARKITAQLVEDEDYQLRPAGRAVDRPAGGDGPAAAVVRAAAGDPGAAGPDPVPAAAGPRPHPGMAAAGKAPRGSPGQAVERGLVTGQDEDRPRHPGG